VRLVSLCPSITESLVALGLADELAGITRYCVHPREAVARIPKIGGTKKPRPRRDPGGGPGPRLRQREENRKEDVEALRREFQLDVSHPRTVAEVPALLRHFGRLTGKEEKAREIASKVEKVLERVEREVRRAAGAADGARGGDAAGGAWPRFRYVYLIWKDPLMTVGSRTYVADLLRRAGGLSSLEESSGDLASDYPVTSEAEILASRPDVLILPDEPYRFREEHAVFWRGRLPRSCRVVLVPGDDFCWHGVRTLRGLDAAAELAASGVAR